MSVSRRTDIPACYANWFFERLKEGFVFVQSPMSRKISRVELSADVVDGIVFWSKNPAPMLDRLHLLKEFAYYFQCTVTPYGTDIEPNVPDKRKEIIPTFVRLSDVIGAERVVWRYDPVLLNSRYDTEFHLRAFAALAKALYGHTKKCVFSFVDDYRSTGRNRGALSLLEISQEQKLELGKAFSDIASAYGMAIETCAEKIDLSKFGVGRARCVDARLLESISGRALNVKKAQGQRKLCGCAQSTDIGMYNSCNNGCLYCYANFSPALMRKNAAAHDPASPLLCGRVEDENGQTSI